jgi:hypothetical protein
MIRLIVDENIHEGTPLLDLFRKSRMGQTGVMEYEYLSVSRPGIPDVEILTKVLNAQTILLTMDRVLHMQALARGFRSFILDPEGHLTDRPLAEVPLKSVPQSVHKHLLENYHTEWHPLARLLKKGLTEKKLELYRTARRRIRSHFGSASSISAVSITIGCTDTVKGTLSGFVFNIEGTSGVKGLRAREGYYLAEPAQSDFALPLLTALREALLFQLDRVRTSLYITDEHVLQLCQEVQAHADAPPLKLQACLWMLLRAWPHLTVLPCRKGPFHESMRSRLKALQSLASNEIQKLDYDSLASLILAYPDIDTP